MVRTINTATQGGICEGLQRKYTLKPLEQRLSIGTVVSFTENFKLEIASILVQKYIVSRRYLKSANTVVLNILRKKTPIP